MLGRIVVLMSMDIVGGRLWLEFIVADISNSGDLDLEEIKTVNDFTEIVAGFDLRGISKLLKVEVFGAELLVDLYVIVGVEVKEKNFVLSGDVVIDQFEGCHQGCGFILKGLGKAVDFLDSVFD